jgi:peptide/nickel transport system substrate-binding protein
MKLRRTVALLGSIVFVAVAASGGLAAADTSASAGSGKGGGGGKAGGGGSLVFGLEAETTNYCLSRAQLALSGIQVVDAVYDTLTQPDADGVPQPYLAKSVEPNADFTEWTITLRDGITFHDGSPLDAEVLKANIDSWRGAPGAPNSGPLFSIVFKFVDDVQVVDPMTVKMVLNRPVADLAYGLYGNGRLGIMALAQLNAGEECATKMIGTGPFKLDEYRPNEQTVVVRNPDYWRAGYPKADKITFVPVPDGSARVTQLQGGELDLIHTDNALQLDALRNLGDQVKLLEQKPGFREVRYYILLTSKAPFSDPEAREAFALALDRAKNTSIRNKDIFPVANGLMDREAPGYLKNAGYPKYNLAKAKELVDSVKQRTGGFSVLLGTTNDPDDGAEAQLMKQQLEAAGITADIAAFDQATLINKTLAGDIDVVFWRNEHGASSVHNNTDTYPWFENADAGNILNFSGFSDPTTQGLLDAGRTTTDQAEVKTTYQDFNRAMADGLYVIPAWYVTWTIGSQSDVKVAFPALPDGEGKPQYIGKVATLGLSKG